MNLNALKSKYIDYCRIFTDKINEYFLISKFFKIMKNSNSILILVLGVLIIGNFSSAANNRLKWRRAVCDGFTQNCGNSCSVIFICCSNFCYNNDAKLLFNRYHLLWYGPNLLRYYLLWSNRRMLWQRLLWFDRNLLRRHMLFNVPRVRS